MTSFVKLNPNLSEKQESTPMEHPEISYGDALNQGLRQAMELSDSVVVLGQLVDYGPGVFGSTTGLVERFGPERVRDFPVSESAMTAAGIGAALAGLRPVLAHHRLDFMLYSMDAIVNWMSLWRFKSNMQSTLPMVIRAIVGQGWGQGPQHSKSLHAWFAHVPGLKVAMPATAFDAKGLLLEGVFGENPVIIVEHRSLYSMKDRVPEIPYRVRFGRAAMRRIGTDVTIVAVGVMVPFALRVAGKLAALGVNAEVIDLRTVSPLDTGTVCTSVEKTGRLCVFDPGWQSFGVSAEVIARVAERSGRSLRSDPIRICHPDSHTPMSSALEVFFYPQEETAIESLRALVSGKSQNPSRNRVEVRTSEEFDAAAARQRCMQYRRRILDISQKVTALHAAPAFSCIEMTDVIYQGLMSRTPDGKDFSDAFLMSKGHGCMTQYAILEDLGILSSEELDRYCTPQGLLGAHPDRGNPGIEASTGSLGHGMGIATGMAHAEKILCSGKRIFAVLSDGELQEGSSWEGAMMAANLQLDNLIVFVDLNDFGGLERMSESHAAFYPLKEKFESFGWESAAVNGHDCLAIHRAVMDRRGGRPFALLCQTVKGRGVSFMEHVPIWHYRSPNKEEYATALRELSEVSA